MALFYGTTQDTIVFLYHFEIGRLRLRSHYDRFVGVDEWLAKVWSIGVTQRGL